MRYINEAKQIVRDLLFEDWMDKDDWVKIEKTFLDQTGCSYEEITEQIKTGVSNGYSVEQQVQICKQLLQRYFL